MPRVERAPIQEILSWDLVVKRAMPQQSMLKVVSGFLGIFQCHKNYYLVDTLTLTIISQPFSYEARLDHEPAYLQVLVNYLLSN